MQQSSLENIQKCYLEYFKNETWLMKDNVKVYDIGGSSIGSGCKDIFSNKPFKYISVGGPDEVNADISLSDLHQLPFKDESIDILIFSQGFGRVKQVEILFHEMARVIKPAGIILVIAPSPSPADDSSHREPLFLPDRFNALASSSGLLTIKTWVDERGPSRDLVGVFSKREIETARLSPKNRDDKGALNDFESVYPVINTFDMNPNPQLEFKQGVVRFRKYIQLLHSVKKPSRYFEIGARAGLTFRLADCPSIGVDPAPESTIKIKKNQLLYKCTSDVFFEKHAQFSFLAQEGFDLAFSDGMNLFEFALRDFINLEKYANLGATILIDDIYPNNKAQARRTNRVTRAWTGDIWKMAVCLERYRPDLKFTYLNSFPTGLLIVENLDPKNNILRDLYDKIIDEFLPMKIENGLTAKIIERKEAINYHAFFEILNKSRRA